MWWLRRSVRVSLATLSAFTFGVVLFDALSRMVLDAWTQPWGASLALWFLWGALASGPAVLVAIVIGEGSGERRVRFYVAMWAVAASVSVTPLVLFAPSPLILCILFSGASSGAMYWLLAGRTSGQSSPGSF